MTAEAHHARFYRTHARAWLCAAALGCVWLNAHAVNKGNIGRASITSNGKSTTVGPVTNSGGSTIPVSPTIGGWTQAGNYGVPTGATGATVGHSINGEAVVGGSAQKYPFKATYTLGRADLLAGAASAAIGVGCLLVTGGIAAVGCALLPAALPYLYDWITRSGGRVNPETGALERTDPARCTIAPCYSYFISPSAYAGSTPALSGAKFPTKAEACASAGQFYYPGSNTTFRFLGTVDVIYQACNVLRWDGNNTNGPGSPSIQQTISQQVRSPDSTTGWLPASMDDIAPYMKDVAPDGRVWGEALEKGGEFTMPTPTVTGPAQIQGPEKTTVNPDGTRTVERTQYNFQTSGNTINNTSNVTTTMTYNADNSVRNTTTTTTVPTAEQADKEDACEKRPNSLGCAEADTPDGVIPKETKTITYAEENVFGGGSCPSDKQWSSGTLHQSYKLVDWTGLCANALPARMVVILLAMFAAFLIVMPGKEVRT